MMYNGTDPCSDHLTCSEIFQWAQAFQQVFGQNTLQEFFLQLSPVKYTYCWLGNTMGLGHKSIDGSIVLIVDKLHLLQIAIFTQLLKGPGALKLKDWPPCSRM